MLNTFLYPGSSSFLCLEKASSRVLLPPLCNFPWHPEAEPNQLLPFPFCTVTELNPSQGMKSLSVTQDPTLRGMPHLIYCCAVNILKLVMIFEQRSLCFHFALGPANDIANPGPSVVSAWCLAWSSVNDFEFKYWVVQFFLSRKGTTTKFLWDSFTLLQ